MSTAAHSPKTKARGSRMPSGERINRSPESLTTFRIDYCRNSCPGLRLGITVPVPADCALQYRAKPHRVPCAPLLNAYLIHQSRLALVNPPEQVGACGP